MKEKAWLLQEKAGPYFIGKTEDCCCRRGQGYGKLEMVSSYQHLHNPITECSQFDRIFNIFFRYIKTIEREKNLRYFIFSYKLPNTEKASFWMPFFVP